MRLNANYVCAYACIYQYRTIWLYDMHNFSNLVTHWWLNTNFELVHHIVASLHEKWHLSTSYKLVLHNGHEIRHQNPYKYTYVLWWLQIFALKATVIFQISIFFVPSQNFINYFISCWTTIQRFAITNAKKFGQPTDRQITRLWNTALFVQFIVRQLTLIVMGTLFI